MVAISRVADQTNFANMPLYRPTYYILYIVMCDIMTRGS